MNCYNITLQARVNVRVANVRAETAAEAITTAEHAVDLPQLFDRQHPARAVAFTEYAEDVPEALVDRAGDKDHRESRWYAWHGDRWVPVAATSWFNRPRAER